MARESALDVVARHFLAAADGRSAALAQVALPAGYDGGDDHRLAAPALGAAAGRDYAAADLVAQREGQGVIGAHAVVEITQIGVADTAAHDLDHDFTCWWREGIECRFDHGDIGRRHHPAMCFCAHAINPPGSGCGVCG